MNQQSRASSRSSTRSPKAMYIMMSETPRDYSAIGQLGKQEPSLFSGHPGRRNQLVPDSSILQLKRASPFKQAVQGSRLQVRKESRGQSEKPPMHPGEGLMAKTEISVDRVRKQILQDEEPTNPGSRKSSGRLQKGHLQPMRLARVHGPSMQQCCGILPQKAVNIFGVTATVQRHGQIIANLDSTRQMYQALMSQYATAAAPAPGGSGGRGRFRPDTSESMHRTSIASEEELDDSGDFVSDDELQTGRGGGGGGDSWPFD
ncbi:hypothetical protein BOX15_Mlig003600g2 [Macrostomum lignano]|uniref:Uncharacterized protein n=2 Tax=Macrostomum lignano TaxID=282301 RepID=A0A267DHG8_9PLAT|nr:hypothetical protein BOX15_Mlig003600g1 [Macrostomum lignano]PAA79116.1 hypothetical protein BOX15_Mlig003600g3 [Macrostomum lignano]PAA81263.1 hypothetical protein BOX15_Mlig003600g2 [Macrostomum lignano]